jgi:aconitate hydratase
MGVLPLQFPPGDSVGSLGIDAHERFDVVGIADPMNSGELPKTCTVKAGEVEFEAMVRIDTPKEAEYFRHGGILRYVLRQLLAA